MTNKQRILHMVERWPEDISYDKALYHLWVLKKIDAGLKDIEAGRTRDHEEVFDELERRCDEEGSQAALIGRSRERSGSAAKAGRGAGRAKNGKVLRKPNEKVRKPTS